MFLRVFRGQIVRGCSTGRKKTKHGDNMGPKKTSFPKGFVIVFVSLFQKVILEALSPAPATAGPSFCVVIFPSTVRLERGRNKD